MEHLGATFHDIDTLPVTFGEGLACIYSRPGRALRSWLRWIRADFLQAAMVKIIREGLISFDSDKDEVAIGYSSLADRFRKLPIGFGRERYGEILADAVASAKASIEARNAKIDDSDHKPFSVGYDFGLAAYENLASVLNALLNESPAAEQSDVELLEAAKQFLNRFAKCATNLTTVRKRSFSTRSMQCNSWSPNRQNSKLGFGIG